MRVNYQLNQPQDFSAEMESIPKPRLFALFGCQSFDRLQVEVVVQVQIVQVLPVDQKIEHVVALATDLKACFYPIKLSQLEKLGFLESFEQISLVLGFWGFVVQAVEYPTLEQLLVADAHFNWIPLRCVLFEPRRDKRHITCPSCSTSSLIEWRRCPK